MIRLVLIFLFWGITLQALSENALLKRANTFLKSSKKSDQFRAYNDYKNLYLRALLANKQNIKIDALHGIVKSGRKLHIDVSHYAKELKTLKVTKHSLKKSKNSTPKKTKITINSSHKLQSIGWKTGKLELHFDKTLRNNQINYFTLYDSKYHEYKYVFDIHGSMLMHSQSLIKKGVDKIQLAQYKRTTLRLVIKNRKKLEIHFKKSKQNLIINIIVPQTQSKRKITKKINHNKIIVIDAGHGGKDPGAIGYKHYREKIVVLQIAKELQKLLQARSYKVYMTRSNDKFVKLRNRTKYANRMHADLFISIHANAVGKKIAKKVHGLECYFLDKSRSNRAKRVAAKENSADMSEMNFYAKESFLNTLNSHNIVAANKLAIDLQRGSLASLRKYHKNVKDAGVRPAPFWVLVGAQMPAVLVEVGFITHPAEAKKLVSRKYQKDLALGLANGVERYFFNN